MFSNNYKEATEFLIKLQYSGAMFFVRFFIWFWGGSFEATRAQLEIRLPSNLYYAAALQVNLCQERHRVDNFLHTKFLRIYKITLDKIKDKIL